MLLFLLAGCSMPEAGQYERKEQPHLYWKDIDVVVTDVEKRKSLGVPVRYEAIVSVKSEAFKLSYKDKFKGVGFGGRPKQWDYKEGDIVKAEMLSWVMKSNGKVVKREINRIY